jgi:dipeptidyl aminopeptidase/acylaminoacyl peptidase
MMNSVERLRVLLGVAAIGAVATPTATSRAGLAGPGFTIKDVLSAPFPVDLIAAPAQGKFAWVFNAEGSRNVWVAERAADGGSYHSRALTHYVGDDGVDVGQIEFTPSADAVIYVRGGDLEYLNAPAPNPSDLAHPETQAIWVVPFAGGEPRKIGEGYSPAVSPRGDVVAYLSKGQIWIASLDGHEAPHQAVQARGTCDALRWSPSGDALAFTSNRSDHSFIGVFAMADPSVHYLDPSTDLDGEAAWSPDGTEIAFLRQPWSRDNWDNGPRRTGQPWSVRIANVATGQGRELWKAPVGRGSVFHAIAAANQLFWGAGDRIVFPAELDGWTHLYSVPARGGSVANLSPGAFEVEYVALSPDRTTLVYSSNEGDIERRHVWKQQVDGSQRAAVTSGPGVETAPVISSDDRTVALLRSGATQPMRPAVAGVTADVQDLAPEAIPAGFPSGSLVTPQVVVFHASDGVAVHGQLFLPPGGGVGVRHPALVFLHGGPVRQMLPAFHYMNYYNNAYAMNQYLASRGYVVLAVNYRLGIGYGLNFREAVGGAEAGASEFNDVLAAGRYLQSRPDVDAARVGIWGGSYGGYLTAMGLGRASNLFAAGVDMHGVHEWPHYDFTQTGEAAIYEPDVDPARLRLALQSSPIADVKTWRSPVLLIHGDDDRNVDFSETVRLVAALRAQHVEIEQLVFPDDLHEFLLHRHFIAAYAATAEFFDRRLGGKATRAASGS